MPTITLSYKDHIRHHLNPLHIMCRLIAIGFPRQSAKAICRRVVYSNTNASLPIIRQRIVIFAAPEKLKRCSGPMNWRTSTIKLLLQ